MTETRVTSQSVVTIPIRELFDKQDGKLDDILSELGNKADKSDIAAINGRLDGHDGRLVALEDKRDADKAVKEYRAKVYKTLGAVFAACSAIAVTAGVILSIH